MDEYIKVPIFFNKEVIKEVEQIVNYRNARVMSFEPNKKPTSFEEFVTGCTIRSLEEIRNQNLLAGYDDLGKPYRLKNRLKEYVKKRGMLQKDLAAKTGIDEGNISTMLNNKYQPSLDYFLRVWIALGCPPLNEILYREKD
jgi:DNA-binding XRE family transcriptional regulator